MYHLDDQLEPFLQFEGIAAIVMLMLQTYHVTLRNHQRKVLFSILKILYDFFFIFKFQKCETS